MSALNMSTATGLEVEDVVYESPFEWNIMTHSIAVIVLVLAVLSVILNLNIICTVYCGSQPRRYGYFHLVVMFCLVHMVYFVVKAVHVGVDSLVLLGVAEETRDDGDDLMSRMNAMTPDFLTCSLGTALLLLTAMTSDGLCNACVRSKPIQKCWRSFAGFVALIVGVGLFVGVLVLKFEIFGSSGLSEAAVLLIVTGVYLVTFALIPSFTIVILGTVNWISDRNSSRPLKAARRAARLLDRRVCVLSVPLLLVFLVVTILKFSRDLRIYDDEEESDVTKMVVSVMDIVVDVLFGLYPVLITCSLGRFCCCRNVEDY